MRATSFLPSLVFSCLLALNLLSMAQVKPRETPQPQQHPAATPGEAGKYSGPGSCASSNCHGGVQPKTLVRISQNEYSIWAAQDKHARAYTVLSNSVSLRIGKILGLDQAPNKSDKCLTCHALNVRSEQRAQTFQSIDDGVSCENCHGPAVGWLGPHTLRNWSHEQSLKLGMYDMRDLAKRSDRCLTCHLGTAEKEVDHAMIAAGHPDLTFELESFSSSMPRHWKPAQNANSWLSVQELAVGQAVQLREGLHRLDRRASRPSWPEYAEYECFACHHSLTRPESSWRQAMGYGGRMPGAPVWNPARYAVFRHIATAVDPSTTGQLMAELEKIEQLSGRPAAGDQVAALAAISNPMAHHHHTATFGPSVGLINKFRHGFSAIYLDPVLNGAQLSPDGRKQPNGHDVVDGLGFQQIEKTPNTEATIAPQQSNSVSLANHRQHFAKEVLHIITITGIAGTKPCGNHHAALGSKSHQRVMAFLASMLGIVTSVATLLMPITGQHARVQIHGPTVSR